MPNFECVTAEPNIGVWKVWVPVIAAFIAASVAVWGAYMTYRAQTQNRSLTARIKLAEIRQAWIDDFRKDLSEFVSVSAHPQTADDLRVGYTVLSRIRLRVRFNDPLYQQLTDSMDAAHLVACNLLVKRTGGKIMPLETGYDEDEHPLGLVVRFGGTIIERESDALERTVAKFAATSAGGAMETD